MKDLKLGKNILIISIFTLLTVFAWIGFQVYSAYTKTTIPKIVKELIQPLNPRIEESIIKEIKEKYQVPSEELNVVSQSPTSPEAEKEEEATTGQTATQSGNLEEE
ncbi:hypothetical protein A2Z41_01650 [Microgenomates group bacterium RBG_19FT_COMBO_39_10]|nr:MAG: hypothetical protein A2Z41_01650 [Microgenomates group bacterium RBG_19FT_COMBO_39_10]